MPAVSDSVSAAAAGQSDRVLDPIARTSEVLFGLIMALTFTGTLSAATAGRDDIQALLVGMIGCNIAWGLVDAVMFLMSALTERGHGLQTLRAVRAAEHTGAAHAAIAGALPPVVASVLTAEDYEKIRVGLIQSREPADKAWLTRDDLVGAAAVFLLVFLSTFPVVIPFIVFRDAHVALRASNAVAIVMMFLCGYWLAQHGGYHPWRTGLSVVVLGVALVAIAIALGG